MVVAMEVAVAWAAASVEVLAAASVEVLVVASVEVLVVAVVLEEVLVVASAVGSVWGALASVRAVAETWGWALAAAAAAEEAAAPALNLSPPPPPPGRASRVKSLLTASHCHPRAATGPWRLPLLGGYQAKISLLLTCSSEQAYGRTTVFGSLNGPIPSL